MGFAVNGGQDGGGGARLFEVPLFVYEGDGPGFYFIVPGKTGLFGFGLGVRSCLVKGKELGSCCAWEGM